MASTLSGFAHLKAKDLTSIVEAFLSLWAQKPETHGWQHLYGVSSNVGGGHRADGELGQVLVEFLECVADPATDICQKHKQGTVTTI